MGNIRFSACLTLFVAMGGNTASAYAQSEWETRGNVALQFQAFTSDADHSADHRSNVSLASEIEFYRSIGDSGSITITPFARIDGRDDERTHVDFREFIYTHVADSWEARIGLGKVFWGVAESVNFVDVINQFDSVENDDASAKLGQPMINVLLPRDWGDIDLYILPGFRERTFAGVDGRPRTPVIINDDLAEYESSSEERHVDVAARVSTTLGIWDVGLSAFSGTARDPDIRFDPERGELFPFYYQTTQIGLDIQATLESWLLKAEVVNRQADEIEDHFALVSGFEYSFFDIRESGADLGIVSEWLFDDRDDDIGQPFQNDLLLGLRLALNDEQSLEGLLGVFADLDGGGQIISLEGSRRFGDNIKASLLMRLWENADDDPILSLFSNEDFIQLDIALFF